MLMYCTVLYVCYVMLCVCSVCSVMFMFGMWCAGLFCSVSGLFCSDDYVSVCSTLIPYVQYVMLCGVMF